MAYSSEIAKTLTVQITKFVTLNRHQLAGHVANLDFCLAEVRHCLDVIDGYDRRFEQMKTGQTKHVSEHGTVEFSLDDPCCTQRTAPPPRRVSGAELGEARRNLCDATYRFLVRCFNEGFIQEDLFRRTCGSLDIGVEASDLRLRTLSCLSNAAESSAYVEEVGRGDGTLQARRYRFWLTTIGARNGLHSIVDFHLMPPTGGRSEYATRSRPTHRPANEGWFSAFRHAPNDSALASCPGSGCQAAGSRANRVLVRRSDRGVDRLPISQPCHHDQRPIWRVLALCE